MLSLERPVTAIPKIGPKFKILLERLGIYTVEDLVYHFPFRYEDYSKSKPIADLEEGDTVTVDVILDEVNNFFTRNGKRLTKAKISDETGAMTVIWFNQHYIRDSLKPGRKYKVSGKVNIFDRKPAFFGPEFEPATSNTINTGRLVPVYPETSGISSKWIRSRINDVTNGNSPYGEFLPDNIIKNHHLLDFHKALSDIHFPESENDVRIARERFEFEEMFMELLKVEKRKQEWNRKLRGPDMSYEKHSVEVNNFVSGLPFMLTASQESAVAEILKDMEHEHPSNRLLEGDVGTGKTIVAVISAYLTYLNGYRTIYMAPTEILANQHYATFGSFFENRDIVVELITGANKPKNKNWNVLIGTHALLFSPGESEGVGLVVIDEQHRFGVEQRAKLLHMNKGIYVPHLLTMTATPIPRTLALTLFGDLSISTLTTPPNKNKKITTSVVPQRQRDATYKLIREKNEPTFIVCPLIEESESASLGNVKAAEAEFESLKNGVFAGVKMGLLHGRMKSKGKQEVVEKFKSGDIKILVSTPVIEVGIDVPEATVMVIESAERYGLASLHQLRGRVGRGDKPGYCLVFMSNNSQKAFQRLKHLENTDNGLELAEIDLRIRGEGDIYGTMQHGFKKFKVANLGNIELLETAKEAAQKYYPQLDNYPKLKEKLDSRSGRLVEKN